MFGIKAVEEWVDSRNLFVGFSGSPLQASMGRCFLNEEKLR